MNFLRKLWAIPTSKEKRSIIGLVAMMVISAGLEIVGIGLIVPVIGIMARPELAEQNAIIARIREVVGPDTGMQSFVLALSLIIILLFLGKNLFLILQAYLQSRFVFAMGARLGASLYNKYINAPYSFHLDRNAGHLLASLGITAGAIPSGVMVPTMMLVSEALVIGCILITLLVLAPVVTLALASIIGVLSLALYLVTHKYNYRIGRDRHRENLEVSKYALQGIKAIKETKIRNVETFFIEEYSTHLSKQGHLQALQQFLGNIPRFVIEAMVVVLGLGTLGMLLLAEMAEGTIILTLSLMAVSMVRLMPSFTRVQYCLTRIKQNQHTLERFRDEAIDMPTEDKTPSQPELSFDDKITLDHLTFRYQPNDPDIIQDFSLEIPKNTSVAFVGPTGCGKTMIIDIVLGLLKPTSGAVKVDGIDIEDNLPAWQTRIGYVPQFIFLLDDTIEANVAFGVPPEEVDTARVRECLKTAQILGYVDGLAEKTKTLVGDNGIRLSGGQRQRIGIARALYHDPDVLVLDEATSALDNETEKAFVDALKTLHGKLTILMVAHRLTTVENCDRVIRL